MRCLLALSILTVLITSTASQVCENGRVWNTCGSACPLTCDNYQEIISCTLQCVQGCFCPSGTVATSDNSQCIPPSQCHTTTTPTTTPTTTRATTRAATTSTPSASVCSNNLVFQECGTACPLTCDNLNDGPRVCPAVCVRGCFCPTGMVQLGDRCVDRSECPNNVTTTTSTTPIPVSPSATTPVCANNQVFQECGTACPLTCDNLNAGPRPCTLNCVRGCFCPTGMVQSGDRCVDRSECPTTTSSTAPVCVNGQVFETCGTACPLTCDNYESPPPCTKQCVAGCFCPRGTVLATQGGQCIQPSNCPMVTTPPTINEEQCRLRGSGWEYRNCGSLCPVTCDTLLGKSPCFSLRCAAAGCYCKQDHVMIGGDCMPFNTTCYNIATLPPGVEPSPALVKLKISNIGMEEFMTHQDAFLSSVRSLLSTRGVGDVQTRVHSVNQDEHLVVIIELSGDSITSEQATQIASLLQSGASTLTLEIVEVTASNSDSDSDDDNLVLSDKAIIGIAVGVGVVCLILFILLTAILTMCIMSRTSKRSKRDSDFPMSYVDEAKE